MPNILFHFLFCKTGSLFFCELWLSPPHLKGGWAPLRTSSPTSPGQGFPTDTCISRKSRCIQGVVHQNKSVRVQVHGKGFAVKLHEVVGRLSAARMVLHLEHIKKTRQMICQSCKMTGPCTQSVAGVSGTYLSTTQYCTHFLTSPSSRSSCHKQKSRLYLKTTAFSLVCAFNHCWIWAVIGPWRFDQKWQT